jgi:hypothetical protein
VSAQQDCWKCRFFDCVDAGIAAQAELSLNGEAERDVQDDFLQRQADGHILDGKGVGRTYQTKAWSLDVRPYRVRQKIYLVTKLPESFDHLAHCYWSAAILIEGLGRHKQHPPLHDGGQSSWPPGLVTCCAINPYRHTGGGKVPRN